MKKFLMIGLLVGSLAIVAGCSKTPAPAPQTPIAQTTPAPSTTTPTTVASGKDIYDKNCLGCHGPGGVGGASGPALNAEKLPLAEVIETTKKGKEKMPAYATVLKDTEIQAVAQYVSDLKK